MRRRPVHSDPGGHLGHLRAAQNRPNRVQTLLNHDKTTSANPGLPESRRRGDVELRVTEPTTVADHLADECRASVDGGHAANILS
jgi:hypothetical protein